VKSKGNLADPLTKPLGEEYDIRNIEGNETGATWKQTSDGNSTFVIGDPMKKVHMGKNKSFVSFAYTQIDFYQFPFSPFLWCKKVLELH